MVGNFAVLSALIAVSFGVYSIEPDAQYRMVWNVREQGSSIETTDAAEGAEIARIKLTPPGLFRADRNIVDEKGDKLITVGTQLVLLQSQEVIACTIGPVRKGGAERALFFGSLKRVCLVDTDRDGKFDSRFTQATNGPAFFLLRGRLSGRIQPIAPVALVQLDPDLIEGGPRISIRLEKGSRVDRYVALEADVGNDRHPFPIALNIKADTAALPKTFPLYGGEIQISGVKNGAFKVAVINSFQVEEIDFWD